MRRFFVVGLGAFDFEGLHEGGLALGFFADLVEEFALLDDDGVELFEVALEVGHVGFEFFEAGIVWSLHQARIPLATSPWTSVRR